MKPVIILDNVFVKYSSPDEKIGTFKEYAIRFIKGQLRFKEFTALNNVNLLVDEGEILGIIGQNGAGKSTLLKVISRVLAPTKGRVRLRGNVSPLLELGAGFHPELTGRENIFVNGTLLGHNRHDIEEHIDEIIEFAGLQAFIDAPLRTYSTGMGARLGFAIATTWQPEILILDEVLSVGDEAFQNKCALRMETFRKAGTTTLISSHSAASIQQMCTRAIWLDHGSIMAEGTPADMIAMYRKAQQLQRLSLGKQPAPSQPVKQR